MYRPNSFFAQHPVTYLVLIVACVVALFAWKGCQPDNLGMNLKPFDEPLKLPEH
jgi:hypothetical protein